MQAVLTEAQLENFRTNLCEGHKSGTCKDYDSCSNSHCLTWQRRNPFEVLYAPKLCPEIQFVRRGNKMSLVRRCNRGRECSYAHSKEEELYHPLMYKTKMCNAQPSCYRCHCPFAHNRNELRDPLANPQVRAFWGQSKKCVHQDEEIIDTARSSSLLRKDKQKRCSKASLSKKTRGGENTVPMWSNNKEGDAYCNLSKSNAVAENGRVAYAVQPPPPLQSCCSNNYSFPSGCRDLNAHRPNPGRDLGSRDRESPGAELAAVPPPPPSAPTTTSPYDWAVNVDSSSVGHSADKNTIGSFIDPAVGSSDNLPVTLMNRSTTAVGGTTSMNWISFDQQHQSSNINEYKMPVRRSPSYPLESPAGSLTANNHQYSPVTSAGVDNAHVNQRLQQPQQQSCMSNEVLRTVKGELTRLRTDLSEDQLGIVLQLSVALARQITESGTDHQTSSPLSRQDCSNYPQQQHDLQQHDLQQHDLQQHDLQQHDLQQHDLQQHDLQQHDLQQHDLQQHDLQQHDLQQHDLQQYDLQQHDLQQHDLQQHDLQRHDLQQHVTDVVTPMHLQNQSAAHLQNQSAVHPQIHPQNQFEVYPQTARQTTFCNPINTAEVTGGQHRHYSSYNNAGTGTARKCPSMHTTTATAPTKHFDHNCNGVRDISDISPIGSVNDAMKTDLVEDCVYPKQSISGAKTSVFSKLSNMASASALMEHQSSLTSNFAAANSISWRRSGTGFDTFLTKLTDTDPTFNRNDSASTTAPPSRGDSNSTTTMLFSRGNSSSTVCGLSSESQSETGDAFQASPGMQSPLPVGRTLADSPGVYPDSSDSRSGSFTLSAVGSSSGLTNPSTFPDCRSVCISSNDRCNMEIGAQTDKPCTYYGLTNRHHIGQSNINSGPVYRPHFCSSMSSCNSTSASGSRSVCSTDSYSYIENVSGRSTNSHRIENHQDQEGSRVVDFTSAPQASNTRVHPTVTKVLENMALEDRAAELGMDLSNPYLHYIASALGDEGFYNFDNPSCEMDFNNAIGPLQQLRASSAIHHHLGGRTEDYNQLLSRRNVVDTEYDMLWNEIHNYKYNS